MIDNYMCSLCKAEPLTKRYYENSLFWIADCPERNVPIVVLNEHKRSCTQSDFGEMMKVCKGLFDMTHLKIDFCDKESKHFYFHLMPLDAVVDEEPEKEVEDEEKEQED